jgi:DNA helicase-2/ATP-dependent DNA helicase PcrA
MGTLTMPMPRDRTASLPQTDPIDRLRQRLRPGQRELADWQGGALAVSAVPGAGKSTGMAVAAAIAIAHHQLTLRHQLIVVTFTRSAAASIKAKIRAYLKELGLPATGFSVYTLHGLAWAIARSQPELAGIPLDSVLITPSHNHRLIRTAVEQWISANPRGYQALIEGRHFDGEETERLRRQSVLRTEVLPELAATVIHEAKSSGLQPDDLRQQSLPIDDPYSTLAIAADLYELYQQQLQRRGLIDYDEMMLAALRVLANPTVRHLWQAQVFAVFEDEAQDSSPLQTRLLELLATDPDSPQQRHLVRVGDPNQAINSTFTPADPIFFREFCAECDRHQRLATMTQAGRSAQPIIDAANFVVGWVNRTYGQSQDAEPDLLVEAPFREQAIQPVPPDDPQPNPTPVGNGLELAMHADIFQTVEQIGQRTVQLFQQNPQANAAVLVRENKQGQFVAQELQRWYGDRLVVYEVGQRDRQSHVPKDMLTLLQFLDRPHSPDYLKAALTTLVDRQRIPTQDLNALVISPEQFLYPGPLHPESTEAIARARRYCTSLLRARLELPAYQLISFLAYSLDYDQTELATADKLAERLNQQTQGNGSLAAIVQELQTLVSSERFTAVDLADNEVAYTQPGQLTIITMHKAKGLDWDYVFIPFLQENVLPGSLRVPPQSNFLGEFTLAEVARAQIRASLHHQMPLTDVGQAWERAKALKLAEEYRLLYVAMTRAKQLLWMAASHRAPFTWNKPDSLDDRQLPCPILLALQKQFPAFIVS